MSTNKYRTKKRSDQILLTKEALLLKQLRIECGLSMRKAASQIYLSDSYIAHIETGRMDPPKGEKLQRLLSVYGIRSNAYYERLRSFKELTSPLEELSLLIKRMRPKEIDTLLAVAKGLVS